MEIIKNRYKCPYTSEMFDDYDDCVSYIEEHLIQTALEPEEIDNTIYRCEYCYKEYKKEFECKDCEEKHITNQDKHYVTVTELRSKMLLEDAANHRSQLSLQIYTN